MGWESRSELVEIYEQNQHICRLPFLLSLSHVHLSQHIIPEF